MASSGQDPLQALMRGFAISDVCKVVDLRGDPIAMFGLVRLPEDEGAVWMLGSDEIERHSTQFLRQCREHARELTAGCKRTGNMVDCRNTVHIRWIQWMGWELVDLIPHFGPVGLPFYRFTRDEGV